MIQNFIIKQLSSISRRLLDNFLKFNLIFRTWCEHGFYHFFSEFSFQLYLSILISIFNIWQGYKILAIFPFITLAWFFWILRSIFACKFLNTTTAKRRQLVMNLFRWLLDKKPISKHILWVFIYIFSIVFVVVVVVSVRFAIFFSGNLVSPQYVLLIKRHFLNIVANVLFLV